MWGRLGVGVLPSVTTAAIVKDMSRQLNLMNTDRFPDSLPFRWHRSHLFNPRKRIWSALEVCKLCFNVFHFNNESVYVAGQVITSCKCHALPQSEWQCISRDYSTPRGHEFHFWGWNTLKFIVVPLYTLDVECFPSKTFKIHIWLYSLSANQRRLRTFSHHTIAIGSDVWCVLRGVVYTWNRCVSLDGDAVSIKILYNKGGILRLAQVRLELPGPEPIVYVYRAPKCEKVK